MGAAVISPFPVLCRRVRGARGWVWWRWDGPALRARRAALPAAQRSG